jgi:hypothetical protein
MASCFLNSPLSPRQPSVLSTALCLLYSHMFTLHPYLTLYGLLLSLQPSVPSLEPFAFSTALSRLDGSLFLYGFSSSKACCPLLDPLPTLQPSVTL